MAVRSNVALSLILAAVVALSGGCAGGGDDVSSRTDTLPGVDGGVHAEVGTVTGQVVSLRTSAPLTSVRLVVGGVAAVTDADGVFRAEGLPVGEAWLTLDDSRYAILGGPVRIEVNAGVNAIGEVVVDTGGDLPPAPPVL